ncbi:MAG: UDP-N-acetylmuramoyl-tripeptide--D-alanyl-D-alanine ligase [Actinomycetota bacterium]|nr:UDP-N-acetylmuramoyl-tripeptide--D-alanyl-D-alanine ligase [Actinomycetota bacterium]
MKEKIELKKILAWTGSKLVSGYENGYIYDISTDTRTLKEGDFFIPVRGDNYNGHDFIGKALEGKAGGFVFEKDYSGDLSLWNKKIKDNSLDDGVIIKSKDNLRFLKDISYNYIRKFNPSIIGITGSVGKTTTKNFLVNILNLKNSVEYTPRNYNTEIGVSKSILDIDKKTDFFIAEMGMRGKGQIKILADMCNLGIGAITGISESHLAFFRGLEEIAVTKAEMAEIISANRGVLFLNNDDRYSNLIEEKVNCRVIRFGRDNEVKFNFIEKEMDDLGRFTFGLFKNSIHVADIKLNIPGYHNLYNACCAAAIALHLGAGAEEVRKGIEEAHVERSRMEVLKKRGRIIIDDCYNSSPLSVKKAVDTLVMVSKIKKMRSVAILGDMLELGRKSSGLHREVGRYLFERKVDILIAVGDSARYIYNGYRDNESFNEENYPSYYFSGKKQLGKEIGNLVKDGDLILLKGSRAKKMEDIIKLI